MYRLGNNIYNDIKYIHFLSQYPPQVRACKLQMPNLLEELKLGLLQCLSKDIGRMSGNRDIGRRNLLCLKFITNKMTVNLNVLSSFMKHGVGRNVKSSLIITKQWSCVELRDLNITQKISYPFQLRTSDSHRSILGFRERSR